MKTGFIHGFLNLMKPVTYPYHGILNRCGKQPEIPPYMGPDMKPPGEEWILVYEGSLYAGSHGYWQFWPSGFLKSSDDYLCAGQGAGGKTMYYFFEVYVYQRVEYELVALYWSDGIQCKVSWIAGNYYYIYKAHFNHNYYMMGPIVQVFNCGPSSFGRIWKSLTGEFPGYYPFPQKEIIRV